MKKKRSAKSTARNITEEKVIADSAQEKAHHTKYQRKKRLVEKDKEADAKKEKVVVSNDFFRGVDNEHKEYDYIAKAAEEDNGTIENDDSGYGDVEALVLLNNIADAFGINNIKIEEEEEPESELKAVLEEESVFGQEAIEEVAQEVKQESESAFSQEAVEEKVEQNTVVQNYVDTDVLDKLSKTTERYFWYKKTLSNDDEFSVEYSNDKVPSASVTNNKGLLLATYRVYVDGVLVTWDDMYEVKIPEGSIVDVETGTYFIIPQSIKISVKGTPDVLEKYSLKFIGPLEPLDCCNAGETIIARFKAEDYAYLSKIGRAVECRIIS